MHFSLLNYNCRIGDNIVLAVCFGKKISSCQQFASFKYKMGAGKMYCFNFFS